MASLLQSVRDSIMNAAQNPQTVILDRNDGAFKSAAINIPHEDGTIYVMSTWDPNPSYDRIRVILRDVLTSPLELVPNEHGDNFYRQWIEAEGAYAYWSESRVTTTGETK